VAYGGDALMVEATRSQDLANRLPLTPGQSVWVGINQIHALTHPGLRLLILTDGSPLSRAALAFAGPIAKMAHARVTILCYGVAGNALREHVQEVKEQFGSGLAALEIRTSAASPDLAVLQEVEREPVDLMVMGHDGQSSVALAERLLQWSQPHLLLVPKEQPVPTHALICVASGEPGKEDVLFSGRLVRHLGASATLLAVLSESQNNEQSKKRTERFLANGARTLGFLDVPAQTSLRVGPVYDEIQRELSSSPYDLLVLGMPLPNQEGKITLAGLIGQLVRAVTDRPILLVRSSSESRLLAPYSGINTTTTHPNVINVIKESL
jgi:sulfate transport system ATP-binding protein